MIRNIDGPLTNSQITDFFQESGYADFFTVESMIEEMIIENYIRASVLFNATEYYITPKGEETLRMFDGDISVAIKNDINAYLSKNKFDIKMRNSITAYVRNTKKDEYYVELGASEGNTPLINIKIACISEAQAKKFCENWRNASTDIYSNIIKTLGQIN